MHSGHGFAYDTMRRAEVYSRHQHHLEAAAAGQDSLSLQHSLASSAANLDHQVRSPVKFVRVNWKPRTSSWRRKVDPWLPKLKFPQCLLFFLWSGLWKRPPPHSMVNKLSSLIFPWDLKFNHFLQTNADGDTTTTAAAGSTPAVGFPHSDVHFPIKKEFGQFLVKVKRSQNVLKCFILQGSDPENTIIRATIIMIIWCLAWFLQMSFVQSLEDCHCSAPLQSIKSLWQKCKEGFRHQNAWMHHY